MLFDYVLIFGVLAFALGVLRCLTLMVTKTNPLSGGIVLLVGAGSVFYASTLKDEPLQSADFANSVYRVIGALN